MHCVGRRQELRAVLSGSRCVFPASVFDPVSARIARHLGYEVAMLAGSVASLAVLGAPDLVVLTLTELAQQAHRITRATDLPLLIDADHGFGNALNVRRTVEELETAGVAGLTIEDTELPQGFAKPGKELVSTEEAMGKFQAALDARQDPALCIFARSTAFIGLAPDQALERIAHYARLPVDGLFLVGVQDWAQLQAVQSLTRLPILLGSTPTTMKDADRLASLSVRIALEGHAPFSAAVDAVYASLRAQRERTNPGTIAPEMPLPLLPHLTQESLYKEWAARYLQAGG